MNPLTQKEATRKWTEEREALERNGKPQLTNMHKFNVATIDDEFKNSTNLSTNKEMSTDSDDYDMTPSSIDIKNRDKIKAKLLILKRNLLGFN